ncbi:MULTISPECIES: branched-chain amino acid ABC transporter permease [Brenneria]|uniref:Branched-chain amino acid ABC transporter permease n=2 Tax=Brenneria TaxID=71655 RepID=A0A2U1UK90_9GAMM|nr:MULTISPECIES: branched-chain amino acid ABC transporter permease [Brenneria]EHD20400.1 ABC-type transporter, integral membrane subunit [Brenneria sp. EniD312]PWC12616.1 branched-chain amino acid ABC transporter permease [Brenneria sp. CFCC 11842]PWC22078.1 branched-chain amino acid ABC transporter permease [Brenneria nigrifluens DSM 30175 = ATCC 13028]QCR03603.1 branched-chain amino acid ABC transporter permease [Brenneria nigrifluens DSM 30175 = ATCC 13028]
MTAYLFSILVLVAISAIVGLALNMQWGLSGLVNFGLFGFYMLAAYLCGQLTVQWHWDPWLAMLAAVLITALASALVSLISLRLSDDYLAIVTLGFAESLKLAIVHEEWLTRGSLGISGIPRLIGGDGAFLLVVLGALAAIFLLYEGVARAPLGRTARALRDDPLVVATLGKSVLSFRLRLFALGGGAIGVAGCFHAFYYQYIDPTQFGPAITAYAFMAVIIGGRGSNVGVLLSSATVILLLEGTRFLNDYVSWLTPSQLASLRLMLIGLGLIVMLIYRPQGFIREYRLKHRAQK